MKKVSIWSVIIVAVFMVTIMFAQQSQAQFTTKGQWSLGVPLGPDTGFKGEGAIVTEAGKVTNIESAKGVKGGLQMRLVTDQGNKWLVYMGPKWFIENQKVKFEVGDAVEVRGMKHRDAIIATEINKGEWTMKLRNEEDGAPSWECCYPSKLKKE